MVRYGGQIKAFFKYIHEMLNNRISLSGVAFIIVLISIIVFNFVCFKTQLWYLFVADKHKCLQGEVWRLFTYLVPHIDLFHLCADVSCLFIVFLLGTTRDEFVSLFSIWIVCGIFGGVMYCLFDKRFSSLAGSSAATFGLLSFIAISSPQKNICIRLAFLATVIFLFFIALHAIVFNGIVPLTHYRNPGWDHLGGVSAGVIMAIAYIMFRAHRKKQEANL